MRIIAGKYKKKKLITLPGSDIIRPTSDRVKENIFNILQDCIMNKTILDLFSGSGALGIECLSRGAKKVVFVEENKDAIKCIKNNIENIDSGLSSFTVIQKKVSDFLKPNTSQEIFDVIFADPPYHSNWYAKCLEEIEDSKLCSDGCILILEMPLAVEIIQNSENKNWHCTNRKKYGKTKLEFWTYQKII